MRKKLNINEFVWFLILVLFTYYFYSLIHSGDLKLFLHPKMFIYVYMACGFFLVLSVFQVAKIFEQCIKQRFKYGYILFFIPLFLGFVVKPNGLNNSVSNNRGISVLHQHSYKMRNVTDKDLLEVDSSNFYDVLEGLSHNPDQYKGKKINISGFIYKESSFDRNQFVIARMAVACCAADTQIVGLMCNYNNAYKLKENQWVRATGYIDTISISINGIEDKIPLLVLETIKEIEEPKDKYIYP